jgi:anti-sigma B factor antagonist
MELVVMKKGDISIVYIVGKIIADNVADLKKTLNDLLKTDSVHVVIDMKKMDYIDSSGLAALVSKLNDFHKKKGNIHLASMNDTVRKVFDITFLSQHFRIFPGIEEACNGF